MRYGEPYCGYDQGPEKCVRDDEDSGLALGDSLGEGCTVLSADNIAQVLNWHGGDVAGQQYMHLDLIFASLCVPGLRCSNRGSYLEEQTLDQWTAGVWLSGLPASLIWR